MTGAAGWNGQMPAARPQQPPRQAAGAGGGGDNLADILERVLDKGIVIAGDIQINLLDIELLTIKLRLVVASVDKAKEMGIDWWERDPTLSSGHSELEEENRRLRDRLARLEGGDARALGDEPEDAEVEEADDLDVADAGDEPPDDDPADDEVDDELDDEPAEPEPEPAPRRRRARS